MILREGRDADADRFIALIGACWAEYPGCVLDVDGEVPELRALASHFAAAGGALWVAEAAGELLGMVATRPLAPGCFELCKMYVARPCRGTGLAHRLIETAERHALAAGAAEMVLWTDTRFDAAHRFYEKRGFLRQGAIRALGDRSNTIEYRYARPLAGLVVRALDAAAAASAERPLAEVLMAAAASGETLGLPAPLPLAEARAASRRAAKQVALGQRLLLAGWREGVLAGSVQLCLATPADQPHRARLILPLVAPAARRGGLGRALLAAAEQAARGQGRHLLTTEAPADPAALGLLRALGWQQAGRIPGAARDAAGRPLDRVVAWKRL